MLIVHIMGCSVATIQSMRAKIPNKPKPRLPKEEYCRKQTGNVCLQERRVAVESLLALASQLQSAHSVLSEKLRNSINIPDQHALETFMQTVKASSDVRILNPALRTSN